jgi:hypothetical protein
MPKHQNLRANISIAFLNINSYTAPARNMSRIEKWWAIYQMMKENKFAILTIQETHLDNALIHSIGECFGKRLEIINSQLPTNPWTSAGMAFIINKNLIAPKEMEKKELIEGHALAIKFGKTFIWHYTCRGQCKVIITKPLIFFNQLNGSDHTSHKVTKLQESILSACAFGKVAEF